MAPGSIGWQARAMKALWASLALLFLGIGLQKLTAYEALAVAPIASTSPALGWVYALLGPRGASLLFAAIELPTGAGLVLGVFRPRALGAAMAAGAAAATSLITFCFLFTAPGVVVFDHGAALLSLGVGQLFVKDLVLVAAALTALGQSLDARRQPTKARSST